MPKIYKYSRVLSALPHTLRILITLALCFILNPPPSFSQFIYDTRCKIAAGGPVRLEKKSVDLTGIPYAVKQGFAFTLLLGEDGTIGNSAIVASGTQIGCEYPVGSGIEHLAGGRICVGALLDVGSPGNPRVVKSVTCPGFTEFIAPDETTYTDEMSPTDPNHPWYHTSRIDQGNNNFCNGTQDTGAISESDYYLSFTDTNWVPGFLGHQPLGIKVLLRSYAWATAVKEPILPLEYTIVNTGTHQLRGVYIGFEMDAWVSSLSSPVLEDVAGYWADLRTAWAQSVIGIGVTPIGFTILSTPKPFQNLPYYSIRCRKWSQGWAGGPPGAPSDAYLYDALSGSSDSSEPRITPNLWSSIPGSYYFLCSFGPVDTLNPGDTAKVSIALVSGSYFENGVDNLHDNTKQALMLHSRHFLPQVVPPSPKLHIETGYKKVTLNWGPDGTGVNPMDTWDGASQAAELYPPNHWRRINPPEGCPHGGRIFAGYRLYRSEDPAGLANSFTLMAQWDVKDSVGPSFGYHTGIETTFVDSNLVTDKNYWYAVTSYAIPDAYVTEYIDNSGTVVPETLYATQGRESSLLAARKRVDIPFSVSTEPGKVLVVPNPYRVDQDYTFENGGWEGREQAWNESKRLIKFIHLPQQCTIRIYSLRGEIIATLHHDDPSLGEMSWNLISDGGRAIASGLYVFSVESQYGKQIGKFVVIR